MRERVMLPPPATPAQRCFCLSTKAQPSPVVPGIPDAVKLTSPDSAACLCMLEYSHILLPSQQPAQIPNTLTHPYSLDAPVWSLTVNAYAHSMHIWFKAYMYALPAASTKYVGCDLWPWSIHQHGAFTNSSYPMLQQLVWEYTLLLPQDLGIEDSTIPGGDPEASLTPIAGTWATQRLKKVHSSSQNLTRSSTESLQNRDTWVSMRIHWIKRSSKTQKYGTDCCKQEQGLSQTRSHYTHLSAFIFFYFSSPYTFGAPILPCSYTPHYLFAKSHHSLQH